MEILVKNTRLQVEQEVYTIEKKGHSWRMDEKKEPHLLLENGRKIRFREAKRMSREVIVSGCGKGILTHYREFLGVNYAFDTFVWIEESDESVHFEWIILNEQGYEVKEVQWPAPFRCKKKEGYSLLPYRQGILLPNDFDYTYDALAFDGQFCSCAAYLPWLAQIEEEQGYIVINETPWDSKYQVEHKKERIGTMLQIRWLPSLGKMNYRRQLKYYFETEMDYNRACKIYRQYAKETGKLVTLKEKAIKNKNVNALIGASFVHLGIKKNIDKNSSFYDNNNLSNNTRLVHFETCRKQMERLMKKGAGNLYLHLDGWGDPGYDNQHPDCLPACESAGGWKGLQQLSEWLEENDSLLGLHDQYRDYYHKAKSYDKRFALQDANGDYYEHSRWAGGKQNYLCATLAKDYVKRNYEEVLHHGIRLKASYLDVFTCNELDECANPMHRMTRKECASYRELCFDYLHSKNIVPSSEEGNDWAMRSLVFAHYGPYEFMLNEEGTPRMGIPVPLFNLVYHDCMILPWPMEKRKEDYMLYALLNGGAPYLLREGAYANIDGSFQEDGLTIEDKIERANIVSSLHRQLADQEMVSHHFLNPNYTRQETIFANGIRVEINLENGSYCIDTTVR